MSLNRGSKSRKYVLYSSKHWFNNQCNSHFPEENILSISFQFSLEKLHIIGVQEALVSHKLNLTYNERKLWKFKLTKNFVPIKRIIFVNLKSNKNGKVKYFYVTWFLYTAIISTKSSTVKTQIN